MIEEDHQDLDQDEDLPFDMGQIKTTGMTEEPNSERVNFVLARLEPGKEVTKSGQTTSEPVKSEMVKSCAITVPNTMEIAKRKETKRVKRALAIVEAGDYRATMFGRLLGNSACILWRADGSTITPKGIQYFPVENEYEPPLDMPKLEPDEKPVIPEHRQVQRGHRPETIRDESKIILREPMGWCVVINGYMHLEDFLRGPRRKPSLEV